MGEFDTATNSPSNHNGHNGHNGHDVRKMFPQTFALVDLLAMRKQNVTVTVNMNSLFDSDYADEEDYYFYGGLAEEERWEDERAFRHEERQHPGVKSIGHGKAHQQKKLAMPRSQRYQRTTLKFAREYKFACEQIVGVTGEHCLLRYSGASMNRHDPLPKKGQSDWRFKKANRDGIVARSGEWKRHEVRRDRKQLAIMQHETSTEASKSAEFWNSWLDPQPSAFEEQYAEEIAEELRLQEDLEQSDWGDEEEDISDDPQDDDVLDDDEYYFSEFTAERDERWAMIMKWIDHVPTAKSDWDQDAEYLRWMMKRLPKPQEETDATEEGNPPIPRIGLRKSVVVEQKLPETTFFGLRKLELRTPNNPKSRRAEKSERKRKEIRDGRKMKSAELSASMD